MEVYSVTVYKQLAVSPMRGHVQLECPCVVHKKLPYTVMVCDSAQEIHFSSLK